MKIKSDQVYSIKEIAQLLHVDPATVRAEIYAGRLDAYRISSHVFRITGEALRTYLESVRIT